MKKAAALFALLLLTICSFAQHKRSLVFKQSTKAAFDSCEEVAYLVNSMPKPKEPGKLVVPIKNKKAQVFITEEEMEEYNYLGTIKNTSLVLVQMLGPNEETYYLINQLTGKIDTLIDQPVFTRDLTRFVCINNPGVDEPWMIQMGTLNKGIVRKSRPQKVNPHMPAAIRFSNKELLIFRADDDRYWKTAFLTP